MSFFNTKGMGNTLVGYAADTASNVLSAVINNKMAEKREAKAREENYKYNEQAADAADARTRALYKDLYSIEAQMQFAKDAGLSPSVYASGGLSGVSGQGGAQSSGASGISPTVYAAQPASALEAAQIGLINAQTKKTEKESGLVEGQGKLIDAQIIETLQNAGYKKVATEMAEVEKSILLYQDRINKATEQFTIEQMIDESTTMFYNSVIAQEEARRRGLLRKKEEATFQTEINIAKATYLTMLKDLELKDAQIALTEQQRESLYQSVLTNWYNADTNRMNAETQHERLQEEVKQWAIQNGFTEEQLKNAKTKMWIDGVCNVLGTVGNVACAALGAKSISTTTVTNENYHDVYDKNGNYKGTARSGGKTTSVRKGR